MYKYKHVNEMKKQNSSYSNLFDLLRSVNNITPFCFLERKKQDLKLKFLSSFFNQSCKICRANYVLITMEACFCHRINNKKGHCDFLSHNSDFISRNCEIKKSQLSGKMFYSVA